jgi:hypothetical protein
MALRSKQLQGDSRLEAAAVSDAAHIKSGDHGTFVAKIQNALNLLDEAGLDEDGVYGPATAKAVRAYKTARDIVNRAYQQQADDIVGKMTVAAMDAELAELLPAIVPVVVIGKPIFPITPPPPFRPRPAVFAVRTTGAGDGETSDEPKPVQLRAVIRGNPYVTGNAQPFSGVPASVPPHKTYQVDITIEPPLSAGEEVQIEIINTSSTNGSATVSPKSLRASGRVTVTGDRQTQPGHAGQLRIQATLNGEVLATSDGFSVCAHPSAVRIVSSQRLVDPTHIGISVQVQVESDSGNVADLDQAVMNELVEEVHRDSPPFNASGTTVGAPFYQKIGSGSGTDAHGYRPFPGPAGQLDVEQVHVFKCFRCGAQHIPIPASGFEITGKVLTDDGGRTWKLKVTRTPTRTGVRVEPEDGVPRAIFKAGPGLGNPPNIPPEVITKTK